MDGYDLTTPASAASDDGRPVVLVVDDDDDLADTYALWLGDEYDVRTAYGGEEAIEQLDDSIDVVLLDRRMPGVPGDEVLAAIRERDLDCLVSMLTAVAPDSDVVDLPFDEYLVKPVTKTEVVEVVDELLLRSDFDPETREYLALDATADTLDERPQEELRDPAAAEEVRAAAEAAREADAVDEQVAEIERLKLVNSLFRTIDGVIVEADSRAELERRVCERLVAEGPYAFAWVGDYVASFDQFVPRATSEDGSVEADAVAVPETGPVRDAVEGGGVTVLGGGDAVEGAPTVEEALSLAGLAPGGTVAITVPFDHHGTVYGALQVFTDGNREVSEREREVLADLGDAIANAINAIETRELALADTVVELEFRCTDRGDVLVDLSAELGAVVTLRGFVPGAEDALSCYLTVEGAPWEEVEAFLEAAAGVTDVRHIDERGEADLFECTLHENSLLLTLRRTSAVVDSLNVVEGEARVGAEVSPGADPRTVMETLREEFPDTDLAAKRRAEPSVQSVGEFRRELDDLLTDRQRSVLEATYGAGYFDWPRESTAEEVAESLDLSPPTLHEHLREAERKLIRLYLAESTRESAE
jgi:predicted DNA binding protein/DNA-binding response OmpR family regulator